MSFCLIAGLSYLLRRTLSRSWKDRANGALKPHHSAAASLNRATTFSRHNVASVLASFALHSSRNAFGSSWSRPLNSGRIGGSVGLAGWILSISFISASMLTIWGASLGFEPWGSSCCPCCLVPTIVFFLASSGFLFCLEKLGAPRWPRQFVT
jgi:hypothetical protein